MQHLGVMRLVEKVMFEVSGSRSKVITLRKCDINFVDSFVLKKSVNQPFKFR